MELNISSLYRYSFKVVNVFNLKFVFSDKHLQETQKIQKLALAAAVWVQLPTVVNHVLSIGSESLKLLDIPDEMFGFIIWEPASV